MVGQHALLARVQIQTEIALVFERGLKARAYVHNRVMKTSRERILVTHVGSLPRNDELSDLLIQREEGSAVDTEKLGQAMDKSVQHVVQKQASAGVDIGNDGEQQRVGFQTYVAQRMSGFAGESKRRRGRDYEEFPALIEVLMQRFPKRSRMQNAPEAQS